MRKPTNSLVAYRFPTVDNPLANEIMTRIKLISHIKCFRSTNFDEHIKKLLKEPVTVALWCVIIEV